MHNGDGNLITPCTQGRKGRIDLFPLNPSSCTGSTCHKQLMTFSTTNIKWPRVNHDPHAFLFFKTSHLKICCPHRQAGSPLFLPVPLILPYNFRPGQIPAYLVYPSWYERAIKPVTKHFTRQLGEIKEPECCSIRPVSNSSNCLESPK